MNRYLTPLLAVVAVLGAVGVTVLAVDRSSAETASSAEAGRSDVPSRPFGTVHGSQPLSTLTLLRARRTGARVVTVQLEARLGRGSSQAWMPSLTIENGDNGVRLLDETNIRRHAPLRDAGGECMCSGTPTWVQPGERVVISAKFPAPPAGVEEVSIQAPGFPSFDRVPLGR